MPLADGYVIANTRLHLELVQLPVRAFENEHAAPTDKSLRFNLGVVQL